jgi:hypothetical protein
LPNWCENELTVLGPRDQLERFKIAAAGYEDEAEAIASNLSPEGCGRPLDFNAFVPYPKEYRELDERAREYERQHGRHPPFKDGFNSGGYEWCVENWGTKWNAHEVRLVRRKRSLVYIFDTAWSPPIPVVLAMSRRFPDLTFTLRYWEGGMGFKGIFKAKGDKILKDEHGGYLGHRGG